MLCKDKGVMPFSHIYFHVSSERAERLFFLMMCVGHYHCDGDYIVQRNCYPGYLLLHVLRGRGYAVYEGRKVLFSEGDFMVLDCNLPHCYGTEEGWEILWVHFDGPMARAFYESLSSIRLENPAQGPAMARELQQLYEIFHEGKRVADADIHRRLNDLLTECVAPAAAPAAVSPGMQALAAYIEEHLAEKLTLKALAAQANLSPCYFVRLFKKEMGVTPHQYLLRARVGAAKYLLSTQSLTLREVAFRCGFSDENALIHTFRAVTGMTPGVYGRKAL